MSKRVPASMRTRQSISGLGEGRLSSPVDRANLVKPATRLIVEETLEDESRDALAQGRCEHGAQTGRGCRNGPRTGRLKSADGFVDRLVTRNVGREEPFRSETRKNPKGRTQSLEELAVELLARGHSVRDIEDAFKDEADRLLLPHPAVSEIGEQPRADYEEFATRDLSDYDITLSVRRRYRRAHPTRPWPRCRAWPPEAPHGAAPRCCCTLRRGPGKNPRR